MPTFVRQYPDACSKQPLDDGIKGPESHTQWVRGHGFRRHVGAKDVEDGDYRSQIASQVRHADDGGALETVTGNRLTDLLNSEVGDLELIAVGIEELCLPLLLLLFGGTQRG